MNNFNRKICEIIKDHLTAEPGKQMVIGNGFKLTSDELDRMSDCIAAMVSERLRATEENVCVGVYMERNIYLIPSILALLKLGITYVPISTAIPQERIRYIVGDCKMALLVTSGESCNELTGIPIVDVCNCTDNVVQPFHLTDANSECAYIIYTSGTTGRPKGVCISYRGLYSLLQNLGNPHNTNFSVNSRVLLFASINFDASIAETYGALFHGGCIIIASEEQRNDVKELYQLMCKERVSFCLLPPSLLTRMPSFDLPGMDTLMAGGEAMVPTLREQILGHGYRFMNAYGPTENTVYSSMRDMSEDVPTQNIGRVMSGITGYVVDENLHPVKTGESGELLLGGEQLAIGYLNQPELNKEAFVENPFLGVSRLYRTGDIVKLAEDGSYEFIGRRDSQVKIHGYRIELNEIKRCIENCDGVWQAYVRTEFLGEDKHIVAYIQMREGYPNDPIKGELAARLPSYMMPRFMVFVDQFPMNSNGKVDASQLKNTSMELLTHNNRELTGTENVIMQVMAKVLQVEAINVDAHFFEELGISSMQVMDTIAMLDYAGLYISAKDFYDYPTISQLANRHSDVRQFFWYKPPTHDKKTMVLVSGYTSFVFLYSKFAELIADKYNIFVIESYHDNRIRYHLTSEQLVDKYLEAVLPVQEEFGIDVITGFCLGGELGLYLAHKLYHQTAALPHVVILDGEVDRDKDRSHLTPLMFKGFPKELNLFRLETDQILIVSMPDFVYKGKVTSILSKNPMADVITPHHETDIITDEHRKWAQIYFDRTPGFWKRKYPECHIIYLDVDHWGYLIDVERSTIPLAAFFNELDFTMMK